MPSPSSPDGVSSTQSRSGSTASRTGTVKSKGSAHSGTSKASISITLPTPLVQQDNDYDGQVSVRGLSAEKHPQTPLSDERKQKAGTSVGETSGYPTSGTIPPVGTPTRSTQRIHVLNDEEVKKIIAARIIERAWLSFRDRQMFKLLKHAVCAAEHSMSYEILRKVSPKEAYLLNDKGMSTRMRFRFGGREFPPMIFFKIYSNVAEGASVKYVSGKKMIKPASEAAKDACALMGNRKFYEQMIQDMMQQERYRVTSETDITTLKDYMQYLSLLDETPAYMGGRDNSWRKLTLEVLPRQTVFYDVVDFLYNNHISETLQTQLPNLMSRPVTQDIQLQHMQIISAVRPVPMNTPKTQGSKLASALSSGQNSSRRSRQARIRALKMKRMYDMQKEGTDLTLQKELTMDTIASQVRIEEVPQIFGEDDEEWEEEADRLYEWTQELSFDELLATPRVQSTL